MEVKIKKIEFQFRNQPKRRRVKVTMSSGNKIIIERCYESFQQYGGILEELQETSPLAEKCVGWLHGGTMPYLGRTLESLMG